MCGLNRFSLLFLSPCNVIFSNSKCNRYDNPAFDSSKLCCACGGGQQHLFVDTSTSRNSEGYTCSDISVFLSYGYEDLCSDSYDTIEFTASESCLACGGGEMIQDTWYETEEVQSVQESPEVPESYRCDDSMWNNRKDTYTTYVEVLGIRIPSTTQHRGCGHYTSNPSHCGSFDDRDFTANEMCCGCGGGVHTHTPYQPATYSPYQPPTICVNTDHGNVNSDGYPCAYLKTLDDTENITYVVFEREARELSRFHVSITHSYHKKIT